MAVAADGAVVAPAVADGVVAGAAAGAVAAPADGAMGVAADQAVVAAGWGNGGGGGSSSSGGGWGNGGGGGSSSSGGGGCGGGDGGSSSSSAGGSGGGDGSSGRGSDNHGASYAPSSGGGSGSNSSSVSYDASRNMMKLDLKIGGGEHHGSLEPAPHRSEPEPHQVEPRSHRRHEHEYASSSIRDGYFHDQERRKFDGYFRNVMGGWKERDFIEALNQSVNSIAPSKALAEQNDTTVNSAATSYENSAPAQQNNTPANSTAKSYGRSASAQQRDRTAAGNTQFAIGDLAFMPNEVLAVGLDRASIKRAEALGFRADPQAIALKASDHIITRFTVPPGLGAVRGRSF